MLDLYRLGESAENAPGGTVSRRDLQRFDMEEAMIFDSHAHYDDKAFDGDRDALLSSFPQNGIEGVVNAGADRRSVWKTLELAEQYPFVYAAVGIHPEHVGDMREEDLEWLRGLLAGARVVAVGEIGLDYHWDTPARAAQQALFVRQLELADGAGLPVQIHSRDCCADMLHVLRTHRALLRRGFLMHCYSHGAENLPAFLELGAYFSFGGVACFKNARNVWESVRACPKDRILTETDSPYLSPFRGEKNSPANIPVIAARLAQLRGEDEGAFAAQVAENAQTLFPKCRQ